MVFFWFISFKNRVFINGFRYFFNKPSLFRNFGKKKSYTFYPFLIQSLNRNVIKISSRILSFSIIHFKSLFLRSSLDRGIQIVGTYSARTKSRRRYTCIHVRTIVVGDVTWRGRDIRVSRGTCRTPIVSLHYPPSLSAKSSEARNVVAHSRTLTIRGPRPCDVICTYRLRRTACRACEIQELRA